MSLEGNEWVDDVQVWHVKKNPKTHKPFFCCIGYHCWTPF